MCRTRTNSSDIVPCSRCGQPANPNDSWENGWPLYGRIEVGLPAQAFAFLGGAKHLADKEHFAWWSKGHPALIRNEAQDVVFEWGNGYRYDSTGRYRLCYECQKELLRVLGRFFGIDRQVASIKAELR